MARKHQPETAKKKLHITVAASDVLPAHLSEAEAQPKIRGRAKCGGATRQRSGTRAPQADYCRPRSVADAACYVAVFSWLIPYIARARTARAILFYIFCFSLIFNAFSPHIYFCNPSIFTFKYKCWK
jgi:hypothetical protein